MTDATYPGNPDESTVTFRDAARDWFSGMAGLEAFRRCSSGSRSQNRMAWEAFRGFGLDDILADSPGDDQARVMAAVCIEAGRALFAGPIAEGSVLALCGKKPPATRLIVWASVRTGDAGDVPRVSARLRSGIDQLEGTIAAAPYVDIADAVITPMTKDGEATFGVVDLDSPGVETAVSLQIDGSGIVDLSIDCDIGLQDITGNMASTTSLTAHIEDMLLLSTSARLIGVAEGVGEITREYLGMRQQFGKVLGSFQALQHRAVDGHIDVTLANALLWRLVADWGTLAHRRALLLALKSLASRTAMKMARDGVQLLGGMGFSDEGPVGAYLKHAMVLAARYGGEAYARRRYVEHALDFME